MRKCDIEERSLTNLNDCVKYHINSINKSIDKVLIDINERNPVKLRDYTPYVLVNYGIKNLPMYENPSHIRKNILTKNEARQLGLVINPKDHYHGLGKDIYINAIDSLDNPRAIFKNNNRDRDYLILTIVKDINDNNIIVPIEIETTTDVNKVSIDVNRIKTVYGYDRTNPDLNKYIKDNIRKKSLTKIYDQKKQSTNITSQSTFSTDNIPHSNTDVKSGTSSNNYYM